MIEDISTIHNEYNSEFGSFIFGSAKFYLYYVNDNKAVQILRDEFQTTTRDIPMLLTMLKTRRTETNVTRYYKSKLIIRPETVQEVMSHIAVQHYTGKFSIHSISLIIAIVYRYISFS